MQSDALGSGGPLRYAAIEGRSARPLATLAGWMAYTNGAMGWAFGEAGMADTHGMRDVTLRLLIVGGSAPCFPVFWARVWGTLYG